MRLETPRPDGRTDSRSFGDLLKELKDGSARLIRQEVALLRAELKQSAARLAQHAVWMAIGALVGLLAAGTLVAALSIGLAVALNQVMPLAIAVWLGPLLVGIALGIAAYALIETAKQRMKDQDLAPNKTRDSIKENKEWIQERLT